VFESMICPSEHLQIIRMLGTFI